MNVVPAFIPGHNRRLSQGNSTSSSTTTVKKSSRPGTRTSYLPQRPTSSDSIGKHFDTLDVAAATTMADTLGPGPRSPNLNINRWSHSTTSSLPEHEADLMQSTNRNTGMGTSQPNRPELLSRNLIPKSHYAQAHTTASATTTVSPRKPGSRSRSSKPPSESNNTLYFNGPDMSHSGTGLPSFDLTPDLTFEGDQLGNSHGYFDASWEQSGMQNKYGQPFEGIALQYTTGNARQTRQGQSPGEGYYQSANPNHIGLQKKPSHHRQRDRSANGSRDAGPSASMSSLRGEHGGRRGHRSAIEKEMLSRALARANEAVIMDNAQNFHGAIQAYNEACDILERVMTRSGDLEDRRKLSAIRSTYSTRIAELYDLDNSFAHLMDKELPLAPPVEHYVDETEMERYSMETDEGDNMLIQSLTPSQHMQLPLRQESLLPQLFGGEQYLEPQNSQQARRLPSTENLRVPMDTKYMPPPLSPRRPSSPPPLAPHELVLQSSTHPQNNADTQPVPRKSTETTSWLDTFDETTSSASSSRLSSVDHGSRETHLGHSIEDEFDAAMNAAVDFAYDDDLEDMGMDATPRPSDTGMETGRFGGLHPPVQRLENQPSHESIQSLTHTANGSISGVYIDPDAEEEEALLEMMLAADRATVINDVQQIPISAPRQSDSSGVSARSSGRTWEGSISSPANTNHTTLSTLAESPELPQIPQDKAGDDEETMPALVPFTTAETLAQKQLVPLPQVPATDKQLGLRDRRLSGQSTSQLKIETFRPPSANQSHASLNSLARPGYLELPAHVPADLPRSASNSNLSGVNIPLTPLASIHSADSALHDSPSILGLSHELSAVNNSDENVGPAPSPGILSKMMPPPMSRNESATNLRKQRNLSLATSELDKEIPPTPASAGFNTAERRTTNTSNGGSTQSPSVLTTSTVGGLYLFDHIGDLEEGYIAHASADAQPPAPLEPCPELFLLRPFWLMRCLYQCLAHPRGGYLSQKLFIPRDIWRVKVIKLKGLDDKIAQCDMLTAALLKLAKVDTFDADAVWEELQQFEQIIDSARVALQKKLGSEVGFSGSSNIFKSPTNEEHDPLSSKPTNTTSSAAKSIASSWRKLRSKSSTATFNNTAQSQHNSYPATTPQTARDPYHTHPLGPTMSSLPMTKNSDVSTSRSYARNNRLPPPTPTALPNMLTIHATYMSSLARLCDAVQVLDAIARQVVDPGLKATSETQVGLEFSVRNASEFFAFFVCRFALGDIGVLMDKYLKRAGEWVGN